MINAYGRPKLYGRLSSLVIWSICMGTAILSVQASVGAQPVDVLSTARLAAQSGRRSEALAMLERHLTQHPDDVDARLLHGLVLSWEKRFDEARAELRQVLTTAPAYLDARVALMNVEWWSGNNRDAALLADAVLAVDPGNAQARLVRERVAQRPWAAQFTASHDRFSDDRDSWHEETLALSRKTPAGPLIVRASRANRFSLEDEQIEFEFYPVFRPGTSAFVSAGVSPDHRLYARNRFAFDFYQNVGKGTEVSAGYRRLRFDEPSDIYLAGVTKYIRNWMVSAKGYRVPVADAERSTSAYIMARRYFGADGTSFAGGGYGRGLVREEVRSTSDLMTTKADIVRGEADVAVSPAWRVQFSASTGRERRSYATRWQHTFTAGTLVRF